MLSHFIEKEGIPTAGISLVRAHTEVIKPPRALWVPFEFGRPLGVPDDPAFQNRVLLSLLGLLELPEGPVLVDFPEDVPDFGEATVMSCPVSLDEDEVSNPEEDGIKKAFYREIMSIRPWYDMALSKRGRTTIGASKIAPEKLGDFLYSFIEGKEPENPRDDIGIIYALKLAVEDLKAYYVEGVTAQPGQENASSQGIKDWFWDETIAGKVLLELAQVCSKSADKTMSMMGIHFIAPGDVMQRKMK